jgi:hypothetical protein
MGQAAVKRVMHAAPVFFWIVVGVFFIALLALAGLRLSSGARMRRRLRRVHSRVVSKSKGPSVQLSVKPPKG